ncbi:hypothetical protein [Cellulomonas composti]|uniref:CBM-cenC domain-containing protein n=1 Tax=Cellulomonas composti TaxID=266130 RepID=A0A511JCC5_9CELL|nr:hypothetical protein [Cellulomonas composti]GEL95353.1 hypothetical protein CCO02nite_20110 [Cellulomonas composti]
MISTHTLTAEVVTPDVLRPVGGHYVDVGSWVAGVSTVTTDGFETDLGGWSKGTALSLAREVTSAARTGSCAAAMTVSAPGTQYATTTLTGLTVGRTYEASVWVLRVDLASGAQARLAVVGITAPSFAATTTGTYVRLAVTFTATAASHTLRLVTNYPSALPPYTDGLGHLFLDDYALRATTVWSPVLVWQADPPTIVPGVRLPLSVRDARITLDETWSPYAQVTLTCTTPAPEVLAQIDPRAGVRVQMLARQRFGEGEPLSALSAWRVPTRTVGGVERTNLVTNPSIEASTAGWSTSGATLSRVTSGGFAGTSFLRSTRSAVGTSTVSIVVAGQSGPTTLVASAWVKGTTGRTTYLTLTTQAVGGGATTVHTGDPVLLTGTWQRVTLVVAIPEGRESVGVLAVVTDSTAVADVVDVDAVLCEQETAVLDYFDGASVDTDTDEYAWTGTANASTSTWSPVTWPPGVSAPTLADLSARYAGRNLGQVSADYGVGYNAGVGMRSSTSRPLDLVLVSRDVDEDAGTMTLTCASDEARAQQVASTSTIPTAPAGTSLIDACNLALVRLSTALYAAVDDVTDLVAESLVWTPGTSVWDYLYPLVSSSERRLWCDERGSWRLGYPAAAGEGVLHVTPIRTASVDTLSTDGWYDGVVVEWRWTDSGGVDHVVYESAGPSDSRKVLKVTRERRPQPRVGAARTILRWLTGNGRSVRIEAVSDYGAAPGQVVNVTLPDGTYASGVVQSVTWNLPADRMQITTRDLLEAPAGSWLADSPGVSWADIPVGTDWTEDV